VPEEDGPRLYSRAPRCPADVVDPKHAEIHDLLTRWGNWLRERYEPATCGSLEKDWFKGGAEATPPATAPLEVDPRIEAFDHAMRLVRIRVPQHAEALRLYYVERMIPWDARRNRDSICRLLRIHWKDFDRFMGHCRSMARNILLELDI